MRLASSRTSSAAISSEREASKTILALWSSEVVSVLVRKRNVGRLKREFFELALV